MTALGGFGYAGEQYDQTHFFPPDFPIREPSDHSRDSVSYTHLTLPTKA